MTTEEFPKADEDHLVVYLLGSGYGESQVVLFPGSDRRCMVVDSCLADIGGENLTCTLLHKLGIEKGHVDLLVMTHADNDHIGGATALLDDFDPRKVWYSPFVQSLRACTAVWRGKKAKKIPQNPRKRPHAKNEVKKETYEEALLGFIERIEALDPLRTRMACADAREWEGAPTECAVEPIAPPASHDAELSTWLYRMLESNENDGWIVSNETKRVLDRSRSIADHPNALSIALAIRWAGHRILLCGDVEQREWSKVLHKLSDPDLPRIDLVTDVSLLKVAHHGSDRAFHEAAWRRHTKANGATTVVIAPFNRSAKLPDLELLGRLTRYAGHLGITRDVGGSFERAEAAGWRAALEERVRPLSGPSGLLAVTLHRNGTQRFFAAPDACFFTMPPP